MNIIIREEEEENVIHIIHTDICICTYIYLFISESNKNKNISQKGTKT